jgi:glycerol dehydrogenase-like iron-containing ADH family enzyme
MFGEGTMSTEHATRVFVSPGRYVQGVGVLDRIGEFVSKIGTHPLIIADDTVWAFAGPRVSSSAGRNSPDWRRRRRSPG